MGWIIWMVFVMLVSLCATGLNRLFRDSDSKLLTDISQHARAIAVSLFLVVGGLSTLVASTYQIKAGHVGVVYSFGAIVDQIGEGLQFIAPWRKMIPANIQVQSHLFTGKNRLSSFSSESQDVFVEATLNIRVSPDAVQGLYRTVGPDYFNKDETVGYKSVDIAPNREKIRHSVTERLKKELSPYSIEVPDLLLNNIDFQKEFKKSIEDKQIATQKALEEEQRVQVAKHVAAQSVETAKGEGRAALEKSTLLAEANRKLSASITPELIQYNLVDKLGSKIEVMILPAGQNFILSPEMLKRNKVQAESE